MNLDAATQAVRHKLGTTWPEPTLTEISREIAEAVLAALPEPIGYGVIDGDGRKTLANSRDQARAWSAQANIEGRTPPYRVVALVPVEEA